jgi:hypothetical protein
MVLMQQNVSYGFCIGPIAAHDQKCLPISEFHLLYNADGVSLLQCNYDRESCNSIHFLSVSAHCISGLFIFFIAFDFFIFIFCPSSKID